MRRKPLLLLPLALLFAGYAGPWGGDERIDSGSDAEESAWQIRGSVLPHLGGQLDGHVRLEGIDGHVECQGDVLESR